PGVFPVRIGSWIPLTTSPFLRFSVVDNSLRPPSSPSPPLRPLRLLPSVLSVSSPPSSPSPPLRHLRRTYPPPMFSQTLVPLGSLCITVAVAFVPLFVLLTLLAG